MKGLIAYASKTDNTKRMAEAIYRAVKEEVEVEIAPIDQRPEGDVDFYLVGGYNDKAVLDRESLDYLKTLEGKPVGIFATAGAGPETEQGQDFLDYLKGVHSGPSLGAYLCPGKVSEKLYKLIDLAPAPLVGMVRKDLRGALGSKEVKATLLEFCKASRSATEEELEAAGAYFAERIQALKK